MHAPRPGDQRWIALRSQWLRVQVAA